jgi:hypothetical protein
MEDTRNVGLETEGEEVISTDDRVILKCILKIGYNNVNTFQLAQWWVLIFTVVNLRAT